MNPSIREQLEALGFKPLYPIPLKKDPWITLNGKPLGWWDAPQKPQRKKRKALGHMPAPALTTRQFILL